MNLFLSWLRASRAFFATPYKIGCRSLLKFKMRVPKLELQDYARVHERFLRGMGRQRREATMPLEYRPKIEKIVELLLYLAHKRPDADKYQAVKFFYLADREHLIRYGRPVSFENYYAMHFGPVASTVLEFLNGDLGKAKNVGIKELPFKTEIGKAKNGSVTTYIRTPTRDVNFDLFSKSDIKVFDEVLEKYRNASFDDLFKATHEHFAWLNAWKTRRLGDRAEMFYEEMIEDEKQRAKLVEDFSSVASQM
jgi:uncharacterized phage-associated protein